MTTLFLSPPDAFEPLDPKKRPKRRKAAGVWLTKAELVELEAKLAVLHKSPLLPKAGP